MTDWYKATSWLTVTINWLIQIMTDRYMSTSWLISTGVLCWCKIRTTTLCVYVLSERSFIAADANGMELIIFTHSVHCLLSSLFFMQGIVDWTRGWDYPQNSPFLIWREAALNIASERNLSLLSEIEMIFVSPWLSAFIVSILVPIKPMLCSPPKEDIAIKELVSIFPSFNLTWIVER